MDELSFAIGLFIGFVIGIVVGVLNARRNYAEGVWKLKKQGFLGNKLK